MVLLRKRAADMPVSGKALLKKKWGLRQKKVLLFVGRIDPHKGIFDIIKAFDIVRSKRKNVKLLIVGGGDITGALERCTGFWKDVLFTGYIADKLLLHEVYALADMMLMPSYHEQSSFTFLEGLRNKVPLVLSSIAAFE